MPKNTSVGWLVGLSWSGEAEAETEDEDDADADDDRGSRPPWRCLMVVSSVVPSLCSVSLTKKDERSSAWCPKKALMSFQERKTRWLG